MLYNIPGSLQLLSQLSHAFPNPLTAEEHWALKDIQIKSSSKDKLPNIRIPSILKLFLGEETEI